MSSSHFESFCFTLPSNKHLTVFQYLMPVLSGFSEESTDCSTYKLQAYFEIKMVLFYSVRVCIICKSIKRLITKQFERSQWSMPDCWLSLFQS